jgi:hypothetical protein
MQKYEKAHTIKYAMKHLESLNQKGVQFVSDQEEIYVLLSSGERLRISEEEIKLQATEYLRSEINKLMSI